MSITRFTASSILYPAGGSSLRYGARPFIPGAMKHKIRKRVSFIGAEVKTFIHDIREEQLARGRRPIVDEKLGLDGLIHTKPSNIKVRDPLIANPFINVSVKSCETDQTFTKPKLARTQPNRFNYCDN